MTELLDLSIETLMTACKGNVKMLPSFMVHDDEVWPRNVVRTDNKGRIHLRRSTFNRSVSVHLPVRPGLWLGSHVREFFLDLKPHHLQGSQDVTGEKSKDVARKVARMDSAGRLPGDEDYGEADTRDHRPQDIAADVREAKAAGTSYSIRSAAITPGSDD